MKNKLSKAVVILCASTLLMTGCFSKKKNDEKAKKSQTVKTSYKEDKTTEVLIDSEIKKEDIVKIVKHGDHWHVFTKDGKEHITYQDPNKIGEEGLELVNVVDKNSLKDKNVVKILKHGDHWHVYTKDGGEYLTYENPQGLFPNIKVGKYQGSHHGSSNNSTKNLQDRVVQILVHGDHWHIYTQSGNEYISYQDPRGLYPNASYGVYRGNHGSFAGKNKNNSYNNSSSSNIKGLDKLVKVENNKKFDNVVKILKHGDHWHIYTKDGNESISYVNPQSKYPHIKIGKYEGSHKKEETPKPSRPSKPSNPSHQIKPSIPGQNKKDEKIEAIKNLKLIPILGKGQINRFDIVKILVHGDHYHIFDSKGVEAITYTNPIELFPNAYFGQYEQAKKDEPKKENPKEDEGKKDEQKKENPKEDEGKKEDSKKDNKWPEGITRIVEHKDHWHLYRGNEEVGVVRDNPKEIYPEAEYIVERDDSEDIKVEDDEIFDYDDVRAELIKGVIPYLEGDFAKFTNYGSLSENDAVYGSNGVRENIFYWYHLNHYHAKTIKQIIQMEKNGKFGKYTAKDVVKTIKYKIENPETDLEYTPDISVNEVKKYLKNYYNLDSSDLLNIGDSMVQVFINDDTLNFYVRDFEKKDGKLIYKKEMPQIKKENPENNEEKIEEKEEKTEKKENSSKKEKTIDKENLSKEDKKENYEKEDASSNKKEEKLENSPQKNDKNEKNDEKTELNKEEVKENKEDSQN